MGTKDPYHWIMPELIQMRVPSSKPRHSLASNPFDSNLSTDYYSRIEELRPGGDGALVVLYCTTPKNGILIAAPTRKTKNFETEYSVKSPPSLPSRLDDTQLNWSVTADDDDHVHSSDVTCKRAYRVRLGSQTMMAVTDHGVDDVKTKSSCAGRQRPARP